jgi:ferredoxin--NADP+ reductase
MSNFHTEQVLGVRHWTDRLFSFRTTRAPSFRFQNGQFVMMGLEVEGRPLLRAYSLASANYEDELKFLSIKVPDGPLTSRIQHLKEGDEILVGRKPTGTLLLDNLSAGKTLFLLGTGTGLAPFLSIVKDPETYERFELVVLVHGCRHVAELAYGQFIENELPNDEFVGASVRYKLVYHPTVTREPFRNQGRISTLLTSNSLTCTLGLPALNAATDRVMICGGPEVVADIRAILDARGLNEGAHGRPAEYVVERAFVEK